MTNNSQTNITPFLFNVYHILNFHKLYVYPPILPDPFFQTLSFYNNYLN